MATTESDYYELLGVPRTASDAEIKRAFRALARQLHPDVSGAPEAEQRFRAVAEAYEVLSDPERRATYDRYGRAGLRRGGFEPAFADFGSLADIFAAFFGEDLFGGAATARGASHRGGDLQAVVEIGLDEAFAGVNVSLPVDVALPCERCDASGAEPGSGARSCPTCSGTGVIRSVSRSVFGQFVQQRTCPECGGVGHVLERPCQECGGEGRGVSSRLLEVAIPKGVQDGQQIRVRGAGHAGYRSAERGNAFVVVRVRPHPLFVRDGDDLHTALPLTMVDAALGASATVRALDGDIELEIRPGTQPGEVRVLEGRGMPTVRGSRRGRLLIRLDVMVPTRLTDEQRQVLERLRGTLGPEAYAPNDTGEDEGFLHRLKSVLR